MMLYQEKEVKVIIMSDFKQKDRMRDHLSFTILKSLQNDYIMEIYGMQIILEIKGKIRYTKREKRKQDRNLQEDFYEQKFKDNIKRIPNIFFYVEKIRDFFIFC